MTTLTRISIVVLSALLLTTSMAFAGSCPTYQDAKSRYLSMGDLSGCSCWDLDLLRNEVYARHGRKFKRQDLMYYFQEKSWYRPTGSGTEGHNRYEQKNVATILNYEKSRGCVAGKPKGAPTAAQAETERIFAVTRRYVDANSAPDVRGKYKLKLTARSGRWAIVAVLPTIDIEGAAVVLEKVGGKWVGRDMGTDLSDWEAQVPELFR